MKVVVKTLVQTLILTLSIGIIVSQESPSIDTRAEAEKVWEIAIKAKGGRDKLDGIKSIQGYSETESRFLWKRFVHKEAFLCVLPKKVWSYQGKQGVFGVITSMLDYENMTTYFGEAGGNISLRQIEGNEKHGKGYQNSTILYLMESKWLKPDIIGLRPDKADGVDVRLVETYVDGRRVDFALDKKTYLPIQIRFHNVSSNGKIYIHTARLSKYVEVDGIMVPQKVSYSDTITRGGTEKMTIKFNVEYDPSIFLKPPSKLTPDAWKKKSDNDGK